MTTTYLPATRDIHDTFVDEITSLGGSVPDAYDDGQRLFARAVLAADTEIRPGDSVRAGVAVRAAASEILVHPYVFRQVCSNGAIIAHSLESRHLERAESMEVFLPTYSIVATLADLRRAVRACATREAFAVAADEMRSASEMKPDMSLHLLAVLDRLPPDVVAYAIRAIFPRFEAGGDQSAFGLMNAVTSAARDARDPETRWRLEELGGTMPARLGLQSRTIPSLSEAVSA